MQKMIFSEYEIQQVNRIIDEIYKTMSGLDREECQSAGWCSYMEMKNAFLFQYHTESYWETVINGIVDEFEQMRIERNNKISLESTLSLNQHLGDSEEEAGEILFPIQGDFTNGVILWDYLKGLGEEKYPILRLMSDREEDSDIIEILHLDKNKYFEIKEQLKEDMRVYEES